MKTATKNNSEPPARGFDATTKRVAAVMFDRLHCEQFDTLADLVDAVKGQCAALRIPWTNDAMTGALRLVGASRKLGGGVEGCTPRRVGSGRSTSDRRPPIPSRTEAAALVAELLPPDGPGIRTMPGNRGSDRDHEARVREQARQFRRMGAETAPKRRPLIDRLADIFAGRFDE